MCGRYSLFVDRDDLEERFDAEFVVPYRRTYNAAPGQRHPVIANEAPDEVRALRWGLVPSWAEEDDGGHINARKETAADRPSFRTAHERRRCLVPASGFFEWAETNGAKRPYHVTAADADVFAMAGLWERWEPPETQASLSRFGADDTGTDGDGDSVVLESFAILTGPPNEVVEAIHDRMPVILDPDAEAAWLDGSLEAAALEPIGAERLRAYPVSRRVNDPSNDDPSVVDPAAG